MWFSCSQENAICVHLDLQILLLLNPPGRNLFFLLEEFSAFELSFSCSNFAAPQSLGRPHWILARLQ